MPKNFLAQKLKRSSGRSFGKLRTSIFKQVLFIVSLSNCGGFLNIAAKLNQFHCIIIYIFNQIDVCGDKSWILHDPAIARFCSIDKM